jgi:hypothetical protein
MFLNQILKETQGSIKDIQNTGAPPWFSQADNNGVLMNYSAGARVWHVGVEWISEINNNNAEPGTLGASWIRTSQIMDRIFINDDVLTTGRALTADDINKHLVFGGVADADFDLPLVNSVPSGSVIFVRGGNDGVATFNASGSNGISIGGVGYLSTTCFRSESLLLVSNGFGDWRLTKINPRFDDGSVFTNVTRPFNTFFTNTSGFMRFVYVVVDLAVGARATLVTGNNFDEFVAGTSAMRITVKGTVPAGKTYAVTTSGSVTFQRWTESNVII